MCFSTSSGARSCRSKHTTRRGRRTVAALAEQRVVCDKRSRRVRAGIRQRIHSFVTDTHSFRAYFFALSRWTAARGQASMSRVGSVSMSRRVGRCASQSLLGLTVADCGRNSLKNAVGKLIASAAKLTTPGEDDGARTAWQLGPQLNLGLTTCVDVR